MLFSEVLGKMPYAFHRDAVRDVIDEERDGCLVDLLAVVTRVHAADHQAQRGSHRSGADAVNGHAHPPRVERYFPGGEQPQIIVKS